MAMLVVDAIARREARNAAALARTEEARRQAQPAVDKALAIKADYQQKRAAMLDTNGYPIYTPGEYEHRLFELNQAESAALGDVLGKVEGDLQQAITTANEAIARINGADPLAALSEAELSQASLRREFVQEDIAALNLAELGTRLEAALLAGDKVTMFLYTRYAKSKTGAAPLDQREAAVKLSRLLGQAESKLWPNRQAEIDQHTGRRDVAQLALSFVRRAATTARPQTIRL